MPTIPALQPSKTGPRSDFAYNELRKNVFKYGMDIKWEMANWCRMPREIQSGGPYGASMRRGRYS